MEVKGPLTRAADGTLKGTITDDWGYQFSVTVTREPYTVEVRLVGVPEALWIDGDEAFGLVRAT